MKIPKQGIVIAIDGPAASGKTTVTRILAQRLGFNYIDTGALYRAIACLLVKQQVKIGDPDFEKIAEQIAKITHFEFKQDKLYANGIDFSEQLRLPEISQLASLVSTIPGVRASLLALQRRLGCEGNSILEGRDIGTVIFPDADLKIYLHASLDHRAERRYLQIQPQKLGLGLDEIKEQIYQRDDQDSSRKTSPLKQATDAVAVDTSYLSLEQVIENLEELIRIKVFRTIGPV